MAECEVDEFFEADRGYIRKRLVEWSLSLNNDPHYHNTHTKNIVEQMPARDRRRKRGGRKKREERGGRERDRDWTPKNA